MSAVKHLNRQPGDAVKHLILQVFRTKLDMNLSNLLEPEILD